MCTLPKRIPYQGLLVALSTSLSSHAQEKRIYDLKKKNQELEKFKFVLDYKIKELKKQIEPRENEIKVMKEQIQEVRSHLDPLASFPTIPGRPGGNERKLSWDFPGGPVVKTPMLPLQGAWV